MTDRPRRRRRKAPRTRLRRWFRRQGRLRRGVLSTATAILVLAAAYFTLRPAEGPRDRHEASQVASAEGGPAPATPPSAGGEGAPARPRRRTPAPAVTRVPTVILPPARPAPPAAPRAALVIDDLGQNLSHLDQLADLGIPLSIAVIPGLPASEATVGEAARRGIELLLHQPMEPREERGKDPGKGVLLTGMTAEAIRAQVRANLAAVPGVVGVNNHMGSRFTEDPSGLRALLAEVKDHDLFWLDSRTTPATRGREAARAAGVPSIERDVFLDAAVNAAFIRRQVRKLLETARLRGTAVGIGHPHAETIRVLRELRGELLASGVTLVPVSALVPKGGPAVDGVTALAAATGRRGHGGGAGASREAGMP